MSSPSRAILRAILGWATVVTVLFAISTYFFVLGRSLDLITGTQFGDELAGHYGHPPLGAFYFYSRLTEFPLTVNLLALSYFCILLFGICFVAAFRSRDGFLQGLKKLTRVGRITSSTNWLVAMPMVSTGLLIVVLLVTEFLNSAGVPTGTLCDPKINPNCPTPALLFAGLAYAPIGEELAFRIITPLGFVTPVRFLWGRLLTQQRPSASEFLRVVGLSLLSPEHAKMRIGYRTFSSNGWQGIHWLEWIFVAISSVLFGLAHVESGGGTNWGQGKVVTAAISGITLGIVYLAYGAYSAVLLHWFFDFYIDVLALGLPASAGLSALGLDIAISLSLLVTGALSIIVSTVWLGKRIRERLIPTPYKSQDVASSVVQ